MIRARFPCPQCRRRAGVEIIYGYPTPRMFREAERGRIALGGCIVREDDPDRHCLECRHRWSQT